MHRAAPKGHDLCELSNGWQLADTAPDELADPGGLDRLEWIAARVPGTVASALRDAGQCLTGNPVALEDRDWWFSTRFETKAAGEAEELVLALEGIATVAEVYLNGERVLASESMFAAHELDVSALVRDGTNELAICSRALAPRLRERRRPRARWRTRLASDGALRFYRTMLLGRAPGFAPGPAVVGPWRPVRLERRRTLIVEGLELRPRVEQGRGVLSVRAALRAPGGEQTIDCVALELTGPHGSHGAELVLDGTRVTGQLVIPDVELWWPHTHGTPRLYTARLLVEVGGEQVVVDTRRIGFRELDAGSELEREGVQLRINGVPVFARGALWTPLDLEDPHSTEADLRGALDAVLAAGMNMLRVPGIGCYERECFYDLCDELGILVWQDFMFANFDYPEQDPGFMATVEREARQVLGSLAGRPSLAVLCGGSEVAQQVAMLGLDPSLASGPLYGELLPSLVRDAGVDACYVPSAPWGGDLPFRPDRGVANYYGVGAYLRPLEDVRRSEVKFAAECLAFSNVPDEHALESIAARGELVSHDPAWKAGVPRDAGAGWDFEDVRDHYLRLLFDVDPISLRWTDPERYLELSRALSGEVMAEAFGEWRRQASPCGGALVLWLKDLVPGAGWGVLDHLGAPKVAYHHLRRALAPIAIWSTDEGLGGLVVHVANDGPDPLVAAVRVSLYRDLERLVEETERKIEVAPHGGCTHNVEELLGRFVDPTWAYRFGPPAQDLIVMSLESEREGATKLLAQAFHLPAGRPTSRQPAESLGLSASMQEGSDGSAIVTVSAKRFAYGVRLEVPDFAPADDAFSLEPGHDRRIELSQRVPGAKPGPGHLRALNLAGRVSISPEAEA